MKPFAKPREKTPAPGLAQRTLKSSTISFRASANGRPISGKKQQKRLKSQPSKTTTGNRIPIRVANQMMMIPKFGKDKTLDKTSSKTSFAVSVKHSKSGLTNFEPRPKTNKSTRVLRSTNMASRPKPAAVKPNQKSAAARRMEYWEVIQQSQKFFKEKLKRVAVLEILANQHAELEQDESANSVETITPHLHLKNSGNQTASTRIRQWIDKLSTPKHRVEKYSAPKFPKLKSGPSVRKLALKKSVAVTSLLPNYMSEVYRSPKEIIESSSKFGSADQLDLAPQSVFGVKPKGSPILPKAPFNSLMSLNSMILGISKPKAKKFQSTTSMNKSFTKSKREKPASKSDLDRNLTKKHSKFGGMSKKMARKKSVKELAKSSAVLSIFENIAAVYPSAQDVDTNDYDFIHNPTYEYVYGEQIAIAPSQFSQPEIGVRAKPGEKDINIGGSRLQGASNDVIDKSGFATIQGITSKFSHSNRNSEVDTEIEKYLRKPAAKGKIASRSNSVPRNIIHTVKTKLPEPAQPKRGTLYVIEDPQARVEVRPWIPPAPRPKIIKAKPVWNYANKNSKQSQLSETNETKQIQDSKTQSKVGSRKSSEIFPGVKKTIPRKNAITIRKAPGPVAVALSPSQKPGTSTAPTKAAKQQPAKLSTMSNKVSKSTIPGRQSADKCKPKPKKKPAGFKPKTPINLRLPTPHTGTTNRVALNTPRPGISKGCPSTYNFGVAKRRTSDLGGASSVNTVKKITSKTNSIKREPNSALKTKKQSKVKPKTTNRSEWRSRRNYTPPDPYWANDFVPARIPLDSGPQTNDLELHAHLLAMAAVADESYSESSGLSEIEDFPEFYQPNKRTRPKSPKRKAEIKDKDDKPEA